MTGDRRPNIAKVQLLLSLSGPICLDPVHADRVSAVPDKVLVKSNATNRIETPRPDFKASYLTDGTRQIEVCLCILTQSTSTFYVFILDLLNPPTMPSSEYSDDYGPRDLVGYGPNPPE
jgi:hypothetical protein